VGHETSVASILRTRLSRFVIAAARDRDAQRLARHRAVLGSLSAPLLSDNESMRPADLARLSQPYSETMEPTKADGTMPQRE
jgi:hypothetical protein